MDSSSLVATLRATAERWRMFEPGQTVLVASSGGPDSTALLHALAEMRAEWGVSLVAAQFNHGFRGAEAGADAEYVVGLGDVLGVPVRVGNADVPDIRRRRGGSKQMAARDVRHAWLRRIADEVGAERIALGHTRNDRVETILLNLFRGAGPDGLAGFPAIDLPLVRPLYLVSRAEVESYCASNGLTPRRDPSNSDTAYLRNRTRAELLPYIMSYYNSRVDAALLRLADLVSADNDVLDQIAGALLERLDVARSADEVRLVRAEFDLEPQALRRRVLRQAIARVRGHLVGVRFDLVESMLSDEVAVTDRAVTLPSAGAETVRIIRDSATIRVVRDVPKRSAVPWQIELNMPGCTPVDRSGISIEIACCADSAAVEEFRRKAAPIPGPAHWLVLRRDDVAPPLIVRSWRPGDRIRRRSGQRKVQDLFVDARVPAATRTSIPLLTDRSGRLLAVLGVAQAEIVLSEADAESGSGWLAVAVHQIDR